MEDRRQFFQFISSILDHGARLMAGDGSAGFGQESVVLHLGGQRFRFGTSLAHYRDSIRRALVNQATPPQPPAAVDSAAADCTIAIAVAGTDSWPEVPAWAQACMQDPALHLAMESRPCRVLQQPPGCWQFFDRTRRCGVQLLTSPSSLPPWDGGAPLRNFLHWHLISPSCGLLHAGTLGHAGQGILLAGAGGSGKSGTVLAGLLHGLQSVGDDYVLARLNQGVTAYPLFATLKQDSAGCDRLGIPADSPLREALNWQGKHQFTLSDLGGDQPVDQLRIRALCLPTITGAASTRFLPVNGKEAFLALAPSGLAQMPGDRGTLFSFCAAVARSLPTYRLELGSDPVEISRSIQAFLEAFPA